MNITQNFLNDGQWFKLDCKKTQAVIHHTAGGDGSPVAWWNSNLARVGTAYSIARDGEIRQHFPEAQWASAVNVKDKYNNQILSIEKNSVQIELDNWGGLTWNEADKGWHNWTAWVSGAFVPTSRTLVNYPVCVLENKFRGFKAFEHYHSAQLESLSDLLAEILRKNAGIKKAGLVGKPDLSAADFEINPDAIAGKAGVYTHTNYRRDKSDLFPDENVIALLKSI
jgi:N-acetyl-anhydromuramyl-L-alanine amidase AmpD